MLTHQLLRNTSNNRRIIMPEIISMLWLFCWSNNIQCTIVESLYTLNFGVQPVLTEALFPCSMGNSNYSVTFRTFFKSGAGSCSLEITYLHSWKGKVIQLSLNSCLGVGYSLDFFFPFFFGTEMRNTLEIGWIGQRLKESVGIPGPFLFQNVAQSRIILIPNKNVIRTAHPWVCSA